MENRIKECQLDLFADRTSTATMRANQLRLWFASMAYVLVESIRRLGLQATDLANATCGTIRRKLFKIGALVRISVRRVKLAMASGCPYKTAFAQPTAPSAPPPTPAEQMQTGRQQDREADSRRTRTPALARIARTPQARLAEGGPALEQAAPRDPKPLLKNLSATANRKKLQRL